jgi:hypothetical protein
MATNTEIMMLIITNTNDVVEQYLLLLIMETKQRGKEMLNHRHSCWPLTIVIMIMITTNAAQEQEW